MDGWVGKWMKTGPVYLLGAAVELCMTNNHIISAALGNKC